MSDPRVRAFGVAAKHAREGAEMTQRQVGQALDWPLGKLSRIESGSRATLPRRGEIEQLDALYASDGHLLRVAGYADVSNIDEALRGVVEHYVQAIVDDLRTILLHEENPHP